MIAIEHQANVRQDIGVKTVPKRSRKSESEILDCATGNLLRALKRDMIRKEGKIDREKLRKDGFSDRLLEKLERA